MKTIRMSSEIIVLLFVCTFILIYGCTKPPKVETLPVSSISPVSAKSGGDVKDDGKSEVISRGIVWNTTPNPSLEKYLGVTINGKGKGIFNSNMENLSENTTYYVKAYATNEEGTSYGNEIQFKTTITLYLPDVATAIVSNKTDTSAQCGGTVISDGKSFVTARGVCWSTVTNPSLADSYTVDGSDTGTFTSNINGLTASTTYYVRAYATNNIGTAYGDEKQFSTYTTYLLPVVTTADISNIGQTSATTGGNVSSDGGVPVTQRGVVYGLNHTPVFGTNTHTTNGNGTGSFISNLTSLLPTSTYYVRAYAMNSVGIAYGVEKTFTTGVNKPVIDASGNGYDTVHIGTQIWLKQNLRTTKYNDNTSITNITSATAWTGATSGAYCWYDNSIPTGNLYGALYNWMAANTGKLCPTGFHVPSDAEWATLITYLGGATIAGGKMKETGTTHWNSPNQGATNSSGFTALPGGGRLATDGSFDYKGEIGAWWSSTAASTQDAKGKVLGNSTAAVNTATESKRYGCSVRCLMD